MIPLDVRSEYDATRQEHGLPPHDELDDTDCLMLEYYMIGIVSGVRHALLSIREAKVNA